DVYDNLGQGVVANIARVHLPGRLSDLFRQLFSIISRSGPEDGSPASPERRPECPDSRAACMLLFPGFLAAPAHLAVGFCLVGPLASVREIGRHRLIDRMVVRLYLEHFRREADAIAAGRPVFPVAFKFHGNSAPMLFKNLDVTIDMARDRAADQ